jgi:hypothetical protein
VGLDSTDLEIVDAPKTTKKKEKTQGEKMEIDEIV